MVDDYPRPSAAVLPPKLTLSGPEMDYWWWLRREGFARAARLAHVQAALTGLELISDQRDFEGTEFDVLGALCREERGLKAEVAMFAEEMKRLRP